MEFGLFLLLNVCTALGVMQTNSGETFREMNPRGVGRRSKSFMFYKSNAYNERPCVCPTPQNCNCCEDVTLLLIKSRRRLCANLMYQRNGLNIDISLDSGTIRSMTVTTFRPLKICSLVPGSLFSQVCLNLVELNNFPRSLSICPRFMITTKDQEWRINYTCVSISTELPMANMTMTPAPAMANAPMNAMIMIGPPLLYTAPPGASSGTGSSPGVQGMPGPAMMSAMSPAPGMPGMPPVGMIPAPGTAPASAMSPAMTPGSAMIAGAAPAMTPPPGMAPGSTPAPGMPPASTPPPMAPGASLASLVDGQSRLQSFGAEDRAQYFLHRHPPAYAPDFGHNFTSFDP